MGRLWRCCGSCKEPWRRSTLSLVQKARPTFVQPGFTQSYGGLSHRCEAGEPTSPGFNTQ